MTPKRQEQLEFLLHKLRRLVFDANETRAARAERLITRVMARLRPVWQARQQENVWRAQNRRMHLWT